MEMRGRSMRGWLRVDSEDVLDRASARRSGSSAARRTHARCRGSDGSNPKKQKTGGRWSLLEQREGIDLETATARCVVGRADTLLPTPKNLRREALGRTGSTLS